MPKNSSFCQTFITCSAKETQLFAGVLAKFLSAGSVIRLEGDLGAGKTQFTQGLAEGLGITEAITSPTFALMNHYPSGQDGRFSLNHFDLYRLSSEDELEDIAFWETIESDAISCIEWSDLFPDAMPEEALCVIIEKTDTSNQAILASAPADPQKSPAASVKPQNAPKPTALASIPVTTYSQNSTIHESSKEPDASLSIPDETRRITLLSPEASFDQLSEAFEAAKANQ